MSSATSIKGDQELPAEAGSHGAREATECRNFSTDATSPDGKHRDDAKGTKVSAADDGFRPWHFFVLASLLPATVAVVISRARPRPSTWSSSA